MARLFARMDATMAAAAVWFMDAWTRVERGWRRPLARLALRLKYAFYPLLGIAALCWLGWDWQHARKLDAAENAIFDAIVEWRPVEPRLSGKTVVVEIDDCSIEHVRQQGLGSWPWPRQVHADLLDALDRRGVRAVGIDVMFLDPADAQGDAMLDAMAAGGEGRFVFAASRLDPAFDKASPLHAAQAPGAFALPGARPPGPRVALALPFGQAMAQSSALANIRRDRDGILRDITLREELDGWALPALPLRLAARVEGRAASDYPARIRINWRSQQRMPYVSAADLLAGKPVCDSSAKALPDLDGVVALVGYTAAGISDIKPTPVNPAMPGVEVLAEATEALLHDGAIWMPPAALKYLLAALLVALTAYAFWRGEPHEDVDSVFVAGNVVLLVVACTGLAFFGVFIDIFASLGFVSLCFGLCRMYAAVQRGRAIGNSDFREEYDPRRKGWLVMGRLRFVAEPGLDRFAATLGRREYRRRLRRLFYGGGNAVMIEGIVERKSWLHAILDDLMVLIWEGEDEAAARALAMRELDRLHAALNDADLRLEDHGKVMVCVSAAEIADEDDHDIRDQRLRLRELLGRDLSAVDEWPLSAGNHVVMATGERPGTVASEREMDPCGAGDG